MYFQFSWNVGGRRSPVLVEIDVDYCEILTPQPDLLTPQEREDIELAAHDRLTRRQQEIEDERIEEEEGTDAAACIRRLRMAQR